MNKMLLISTLLVASSSFAQDLVLPGEKWIATFDKFICKAFEPEVSRPDAFEALDVRFEQLTTDSTLDNALLKATFVQDGAACRYNAFILADNTAQDSKLVESKAYAPAGDSDCAAGKAVLDGAFTHTKYLYYGHPHNLAFMVPGVGSESRCNAETIGVNFVVKGKVPTK